MGRTQWRPGETADASWNGSMGWPNKQNTKRKVEVSPKETETRVGRRMVLGVRVRKLGTSHRLENTTQWPTDGQRVGWSDIESMCGFWAGSYSVLPNKRSGTHVLFFGSGFGDRDGV